MTAEDDNQWQLNEFKRITKKKKDSFKSPCSSSESPFKTLESLFNPSFMPWFDPPLIFPQPKVCALPVSVMALNYAFFEVFCSAKRGINTLSNSNSNGDNGLSNSPVNNTSNSINNNNSRTNNTDNATVNANYLRCATPLCGSLFSVLTYSTLDDIPPNNTNDQYRNPKGKKEEQEQGGEGEYNNEGSEQEILQCKNEERDKNKVQYQYSAIPCHYPNHPVLSSFGPHEYCIFRELLLCPYLPKVKDIQPSLDPAHTKKSKDIISSFAVKSVVVAEKLSLDSLWCFIMQLGCIDTLLFIEIRWVLLRLIITSDNIKDEVKGWCDTAMICVRNHSCCSVEGMLVLRRQIAHWFLALHSEIQRLMSTFSTLNILGIEKKYQEEGNSKIMAKEKGQDKDDKDPKKVEKLIIKKVKNQDLINSTNNKEQHKEEDVYRNQLKLASIYTLQSCLSLFTESKIHEGFGFHSSEIPHFPFNFYHTITLPIYLQELLFEKKRNTEEYRKKEGKEKNLEKQKYKEQDGEQDRNKKEQKIEKNGNINVIENTFLHCLSSHEAIHCAMAISIIAKYITANNLSTIDACSILTNNEVISHLLQANKISVESMYNNGSSSNCNDSCKCRMDEEVGVNHMIDKNREISMTLLRPLLECIITSTTSHLSKLRQVGVVLAVGGAIEGTTLKATDNSSKGNSNSNDSRRSRAEIKEAKLYRKAKRMLTYME